MEIKGDRKLLLQHVLHTAAAVHPLLLTQGREHLLADLMCNITAILNNFSEEHPRLKISQHFAFYHLVSTSMFRPILLLFFQFLKSGWWYTVGYVQPLFFFCSRACVLIE